MDAQKRNIIILLFCGIILISCALILAQVATSGLGEEILSSRQQQKEIPEDVESLKAGKVIDGDTFILTDGRKVRLIGIDAPEMQPDNKSQCFAQESKEEISRLLLNRRVRLTKDVSNRDKYGRLLRFVYVEDQAGREVFVNDYLLRLGFARLLNIAPDLRFDKQFLAAADEARFQLRGLWGACY